MPLSRLVHTHIRNDFDSWQFKQLQCLLVTKPLLSCYLIVKFLSYVLLPLCLGLTWFLICALTHDCRLPGLNGEFWKSVAAWEAWLPLIFHQNVAIMHDKIVLFVFLYFNMVVSECLKCQPFHHQSVRSYLPFLAIFIGTLFCS